MNHMSMKIKIIISSLAVAFTFLSLEGLAGKEKVELKFSHKLHVVENEIECSACHAMAESSLKGTDNLMPTMESCGSCHDVEDNEQCATCHSDMDNPRSVPRVVDYFPQFSHKMHLDDGLDCNSCHAGIASKTTVEPYELPNLQDCQSCHIQKKIKPSSHLPNYLHLHGDEARSLAVVDQQTCKNCHSVQYCQNCHEGDNLDRTTHPLNYVFTHSLDARGKERECSVCHTERSFCVECHSQNMVMPHNHTAGWANRIPSDGGRHVAEAQNDLESCMSCHEKDAQIVCQKCHTK
jgi:hypothetical protein